MDWKRYVIALAKYLQSSVYARKFTRKYMATCTVTMAPSYCVLCSLPLWRFVGNPLITFSTPNMTYPIEQMVKLLMVFE